MLRLRQTGILTLGLLLAAAMVLLGVWQLKVYRAQGAEAAARRADAPAVPLIQVARPGQAVGDGFGRTVSFAGRYLPEDQVLLPLPDDPDRVRVLTPLRLNEGGVVAVVRGLAPAGDPPPPPVGAVTQQGVLLPSEKEAGPGAGARSSVVRVPALAQHWPGPLVGGFVTLSPAAAAGQGLEPATVALPSAGGRLRNGAYAAQWWVFAAFALAMAVRMARDLEQVAPVPAEEAGSPT